jgi:hypothetical protein
MPWKHQGRVRRTVARLRLQLTPLRAVIAYLGVVALLLAITMPIVTVLKSNQYSAHHELVAQRADDMAKYVDEQLRRMTSAADLFVGFAMSGAPLIAPEYWVNSSYEARAATALRTGTAGMLSVDSYNRVAALAATKFNGFRNGVVQPGLINLYGVAGITYQGRDWLFKGTNDSFEEYHTMVHTAAAVPRGPVPSTSEPWVLNLVYRLPIFTVRRGRGSLNKDPGAIDPRTGKHPNWNYLWGAVVMVMDIGLFVRSSDFQNLAGPENEYLFESLPTAERLHQTIRYNLANTTLSDYSDTRDSCTTTPGFTGLCFRLRPRRGWNGDGYTTALMIALAVCLVSPALLLAAVFVGVNIAYRVLAPPDGPLTTPFYAALITLPEAVDLWATAPIIMSEVANDFSVQFDWCAQGHNITNTVRLGNAAIAFSTDKSRIVSFALAMMQWSVIAEWPPHVISAMPHDTVTIACVLHRLDHALVHTEGDDIQVVGPDMVTLVTLRHAAIPGQVICTEPFLERHIRNPIAIPKFGHGAPTTAKAPRKGRKGEGPASAGPHQQQRLKSKPPHLSTSSISVGQASDVGTENMAVVDIAAVVSLGSSVLSMPWADEGGAIYMEGYLVPSASTEGHQLSDVLDAIPERHLKHWHRVGGADPHSGASKAHSNSSGVTGLLGASALSVVRRVSVDEFIKFQEAPPSLPGFVLEPALARPLAMALAPLMYAVRDGKQVASVSRLQRAIGVASYNMLALRMVFAALDEASLRSIVSAICGDFANVSAGGYCVEISARAARVVDATLHDAPEAKRRVSSS